MATTTTVRHGQTAKDRARGKASRNAANKSARASWQRDSKSDNKDFPVETCNGKKNRKA